MITEKTVENWKTIYKATENAPESHIFADAADVIDTMEKLWKVFHVAEAVCKEKYFAKGSLGHKRLWQLRNTLAEVAGGL